MYRGKKIAVVHAFFVPKGGGEKLVFDIRNHYSADLFTGALDNRVWDESKVDSDSFARDLYDPKYKFVFLHHDSKIPIWRKVKRQIYFRFSPLINKLNDYDIVIFSGNIAGVGARIKNKSTKKIMYCHTPPRPFTDQFEANINQYPLLLHPLIRLFRRWVIVEYQKELNTMDMVITNSYNTQNRLKQYVGVDSIVIQPAIHTKKYMFKGQKDYYLSYARLENLKRIPLVIEAFKKMPEKKLIICSSGPLAGWVKEQTESNKHQNIKYEGLVTDERLQNLVGNCIAGIYIPVDEDFGIIQCELMAAGKPVIGVNEGGLKETIIDNKTGILIPSDPQVEDLIHAVRLMTPEKALTMKRQCIQQAKKFDISVFFQKMDSILEEV